MRREKRMWVGLSSWVWLKASVLEEDSVSSLTISAFEVVI